MNAMKVLILEDCENTRRWYGHVLGGYDYRIESNLKAAMEAVNSWKPEAIILQGACQNTTASGHHLKYTKNFLSWLRKLGYKGRVIVVTEEYIRVAFAAIFPSTHVISKIDLLEDPRIYLK